MKKLINTMPIVATVALLVAGAFLFAGCEKEKKTSDDITNVKWHLTKFVDVANGNTEEVDVSNDYLWILFKSDNSIDGNGLPNRLNGIYEYNFDRIKIEIGPCTYIGDIFGLESKMCNNLNKVNCIRIEDGVILLYYDNNKKYMQFEKVNEP